MIMRTLEIQLVMKTTILLFFWKGWGSCAVVTNNRAQDVAEMDSADLGNKILPIDGSTPA